MWGDERHTLRVRHLGRADYATTLEAMRDFTLNRTELTPDEVWLLEHDRVFTQGQAGKAEHLLAPGDIPVVQVDRGGQVTYHGPGQLVAYTLLDIKRMTLGVRDLVSHLEHSIMDVLVQYGINAYPRADAPGVYVDDAKIASLGLRIKKGRSYHGLALNVDVDLEPFSRINPCGYQGLQVTRMQDLTGDAVDVGTVGDQWLSGLVSRLGYSDVHQLTEPELQQSSGV